MGVNQVTNDSNFQHNDYDISKLALRNVVTQKMTFNNDSGGDLSLNPGTVLGRKSSNGKLKALESAIADGSEYVVGILMSTIDTLGDTNDQEVSVAIAGEFDRAKVEAELDGTDVLTTEITANGAKEIQDAIAGDSAGLILRTGDELTGYDNQ